MPSTERFFMLSSDKPHINECNKEGHSYHIHGLGWLGVEEIICTVMEQLKWCQCQVRKIFSIQVNSWLMIRLNEFS